MFVELQSNLILLHKFPRNIQTLNLVTIRPVESELLQSERQTWRSKYSQFVILRNRLNLRHSFLVSFCRHFRFKSWNGSPNQV